MKVIDWHYRPPRAGWEDYEADVVAWVDISAFDLAWRLSDQHIAPGGSNGQGDRYHGAGVWFAANRHSEMLIASLDGDQASFTDGRHRFSWLRDHGVVALPLQIPPSQAGLFAQKFGTIVRLSVLPDR